LSYCRVISQQQWKPGGIRRHRGGKKRDREAEERDRRKAR